MIGWPLTIQLSLYPSLQPSLSWLFVAFYVIPVPKERLSNNSNKQYNQQLNRSISWYPSNKFCNQFHNSNKQSLLIIIYAECYLSESYKVEWYWINALNCRQLMRQVFVLGHVSMSPPIDDIKYRITFQITINRSLWRPNVHLHHVCFHHENFEL